MQDWNYSKKFKEIIMEDVPNLSSDMEIENLSSFIFNVDFFEAIPKDILNCIISLMRISSLRALRACNKYLNTYISPRLKIRPPWDKSVLLLLKNTCIGSIMFVHKGIGPDTMIISGILAQSKYLKSIHFHGCMINDSGAAFIAEALKINRILLCLDLFDNHIDYLGIKCLSEALVCNNTLRILDLSYNSIKVAGAIALADALIYNHTLTDLNLKYNYLGDLGVKVLAESLRKNDSIMDLNLGFNHIGILGYESLAKNLLFNETLRNINLTSNSIGDLANKILLEFSKKKKNLNIQVPPYSNSFLELISF